MVELLETQVIYERMKIVFVHFSTTEGYIGPRTHDRIDSVRLYLGVALTVGYRNTPRLNAKRFAKSPPDIICLNDTGIIALVECEFRNTCK